MIGKTLLAPLAMAAVAPVFAFVLFKFSKFKRTKSKPQKKPKMQVIPQKQWSDYWDLTTKFAGQFSIQGQKVKRIGKGSLQVVGKNALPQQSITTFRVLDYVGNRAIIFGILTESKRQSEWMGGVGEQYKQSVGYLTKRNSETEGIGPHTKKGSIVVDGEVKVGWETQLFVQQGGSLLLDVDLTIPRITFINKETNHSRTFTLAEHFKQQPVYVFVSMIKTGQEIQVVE